DDRKRAPLAWHACAALPMTSSVLVVVSMQIAPGCRPAITPTDGSSSAASASDGLYTHVMTRSLASATSRAVEHDFNEPAVGDRASAAPGRTSNTLTSR